MFGYCLKRVDYAHSGAIYGWEEARFRIVTHFPEELYQGCESSHSVLPSLNIAGCFSSQAWVRDCSNLVDIGKNPSMTGLDWCRASTACRAFLAGGTIKTLFYFTGRKARLSEDDTLRLQKILVEGVPEHSSSRMWIGWNKHVLWGCKQQVFAHCTRLQPGIMGCRAWGVNAEKDPLWQTSICSLPVRPGQQNQVLWGSLFV